MIKRGQVAIFVIVGLVIVGLVVGFFALRGRLGLNSIPTELQPVFSYYDSCIEDATRAGISFAETQGGRIDAGEYTPGDNYNPFSSHLFFSGFLVPYWSGVDAQGRVRESVPTRADIERELGTFVAERVALCDFSAQRAQGFNVSFVETPVVEVSVKDSNVDVHVVGALSASYGEQRASQTIRDVQVSSNLGSLHRDALALYDSQRTNAYFDQYAADVLRLYAPVDGVLVQCTPEIWRTRDVIRDVQDALEANIAHIRFSSSSSSDAEKYFSIPMQVSSDARVFYSKDWPLFFEVSPANDELMIAEPLGNQEGLGVLGFCYAPYHFLYDIRFPVMVQLSSGQDVFQFPVVVSVDKNAPRSALSNGTTLATEASDVCAFKSGSVDVSTYDAALAPLEADISYQCFDQRCPLGRTTISGTTASFTGPIPLCSNGYLIARADNYTETKQLFSSNSETRSELILDKLYSVRVNLLVDGTPASDTAVVHFTRADGSASSTILPGQPSISLAEGLYNVTVFVYGNSSITIPGTTKQQCTTVPREGVAGFFGGTEERCFDIQTPETNVDSALRGGGSGSDVYLFESDLQRGAINVYVSSLPKPTTLEQLQSNFELFSLARAEVSPA